MSNTRTVLIEAALVVGFLATGIAAAGVAHANAPQSTSAQRSDVQINSKVLIERKQTDASGRATLQAELTWTFPMAFAEVITGDGKTVHRQRIDLSETSSYGERTLELPVNLSGKTWVRFEAWDIAANGVISQPVWLK